MSVNTDQANFDKCNEVSFEDLQKPIEALSVDYCTTWVQPDEFIDFVLDMLDRMGYDSLPNEDEADDDDELLTFSHVCAKADIQQDSFDYKTNEKLKRKLAKSIRKYISFLRDSNRFISDVELAEADLTKFSNNELLEFFQFDLS